MTRQWQCYRLSIETPSIISVSSLLRLLIHRSIHFVKPLLCHWVLSWVASRACSKRTLIWGSVLVCLARYFLPVNTMPSSATNSMSFRSRNSPLTMMLKRKISNRLSSVSVKKLPLKFAMAQSSVFCLTIILPKACSRFTRCLPVVPCITI